MSHEIFMPALSSTMTEGKIVEWLKNPGDKVERGESVLVVESDKADMDVESFQDGYLAAVLMPEGSTAPVGETIGIIVENIEEIASVQEQNNVEQEVKKTVKSKENNQEEKVNDIKPAKSSISDSMSELKIKVEDSIEDNKQKKVEVNAAIKYNSGRIIASPKAKKLATQMGIDLNKVEGSGPHGRIQAEDILKAKGEPISVPWIGEGDYSPVIKGSEASNKVEFKEKKGISFGNPGEIIQFNTLQKAVNKNMESSLKCALF
tara:strand:+ start:5702 stop:6487 length:786 start_codon:yes stop_codon:yes gene_type:complete